jgi:diguanylate cyclase (GGDEF)-like protein
MRLPRSPLRAHTGSFKLRLVARIVLLSLLPLLVALASLSRMEAGAGELRHLVLLAVLALAASAGLAYVLGRAVVQSVDELTGAVQALGRGDFSLRVATHGSDEFAKLGEAVNETAAQLDARVEELAWERAYGRDAIARLGDALLAAHKPAIVIVESIVDATGAVGGRLILDGEEITTGKLDSALEPLEIPLGDEDDGGGVLLLTTPVGGFSDNARERAQWLASEAWRALENERLHTRLEREALTDGLTNLPNRRQFEDSLAGEISRVERFGGSLGLMLVDLDDFKQVNDRYGHLAGDDVLRAFADVLSDNVRAIDVPARYGGEEFAVLLPQTDAEGSERVAERIRAAMEERVVATFPGALVAVTASFGVAAFPEARTQDALFAAADEALYRAKAGGKNRVVVSRAAEPVH